MVAYDTPLGAGALVFMCGVPGIYIEENGALGLSECLLHRELARLKQLKVEILVSLVEDEELGSVAFEDIADHASKLGVATERFEIADYGVPSCQRASDWRAIRSDATALLQKTKNVAFHCMAGIGRSGMMAGSLLIHLGMSPQKALETIRVGQPGALETDTQVSYLMMSHQSEL